MKYKFVILLIVVALMLSLYAWNPKICFNPDELFYFKSCQGITDFKSIFSIKYFGEYRFQKPPLFYVFVSLFFRLFGVNWFSARLVSIIASILVLIFTYLLGRKMFDEESAFYASGILATTILFFRFGRIVLPEMTLISFMLGAFYFAWRAFQEEKRKLFTLSFFFMGIATLVKGPVGFLLPFLSLLTYSVINRKNLSMGFPWLEGLFINIVFMLLWIVPFAMIHGSKFIDHILGVEITQRVVENISFSSYWAYAWHKILKFLFYVPIIIAQFLPWTAVMVFFFVFYRKVLKKEIARNEHIFLLTWIVVGFLMFSLVPAKRHHYVLCFFPAIALYCISLFDMSLESVKKIFKFLLFIIVAGYLVITMVFLPMVFIDGVDKLSLELKEMLKKEAAPIAVTWRLDPQEIELYINKPVIIIDENAFTRDDIATEKMKNIKDVFYVIIAREEYDKFFAQFIDNLRNIKKTDFAWIKISENWRWRKTIKFPQFYKDLIKDPGDIRKNFNNAFREEVYLFVVRGS